MAGADSAEGCRRRAGAHPNASRGAKICRLDASFSSTLSAASGGTAACAVLAPARAPSAAASPGRCPSSAASLAASARCHLHVSTGRARYHTPAQNQAALPPCNKYAPAAALPAASLASSCAAIYIGAGAALRAMIRSEGVGIPKAQQLR